jgi:ubiquinone/menaquinone biosynthesis C-methylase UbiE
MTGKHEILQHILNQRGYRKYYNIKQGLNLIDLENIKGKKVLEIACGEGMLSLLIANYCESVVGVDILDSAIEGAINNKVKYAIDNCTFYASDIYQTNFEIESFDIIVAEAALHHIIYDMRIGDKLWSYLKPGGKLIFITEPLSYNWISEFMRFIRHHRTHAFGEFSLWYEHIAQFGKKFGKINYYYFDIFSHPFKVLEYLLPINLFKSIIERLWKIDDQIIKKFPSLRRFSPNINIEMRKI